MAIWQQLRALYRNLVKRQAADRDLRDEIDSYSEMLADEKLRDSADVPAARRAAALEMASGTQQIAESVRDIRAGSTLASIVTELLHAIRGLSRSPGITTLAVCMLALGMASSIVVFTLFYNALLKPLPFHEPQRLVSLWETRLYRGVNRAPLSEANFWDVRTRSRVFADLAAYQGDHANMTGNGTPEKVTASFITANFFRTLGVVPVIGRDFVAGEDAAGYENHVVLLGNRFWRSRFAADPRVVGRVLRLDDHAFTVIGVLPSGDPWLSDQLYRPFGYRSAANRSSWEYNTIGRLASGVSAPTALADLRRISGPLAAAYPRDDYGLGFALTSASDWVAPETARRALSILLGAVTLLLLIACLNLANLLLARGLSRQREIAVRMALGAGRGRLVRFVLLESMFVSIGGTLAGLVLADFVLAALRASSFSAVPRLSEAGIDGWVLAFAAALALLTGILSGLAPALRAPAVGIAAALRSSERQTGSRHEGRLRALLVAGEVALSFILLIGAGLLIRSFTSLVAVDSGFQTEHRVLLSLSMPSSYYEKGVGKLFLDRLFARLRSLPDVVHAGAVSDRPLEGGNPGMSIATAVPRNAGAGAPILWAGWRIISPGYFETVGLPLIRGRSFTESDPSIWAESGQAPPPRRVILSHRLAQQLFPFEDAVGRRVTLWKGQSNHEAEIIGVAADSHERGIAEGPAFTVYLPWGSNALPTEIALQTRTEGLSVVPAVRRIVASLDSNLPVADVRSFDEVVSRSLSPQRFNAVLLAIFSGLALVLAMTGLYGVLSYSIGRRTAEIGLRVAVGASRADIFRLTIRGGMRPVLIGIVLGVLGALWLSRYLAALLFGVKPADVPTYLAVTALLLVTALLACYLPGRRAMKIDPVIALRAE